MGSQFSKSRFLPKYFRDFNIENRALNKIDEREKLRKRIETWDGLDVSPRHPSTVKILKEIEEANKNAEIDGFKKEHVEHLKHVKVYSKDGQPANSQQSKVDKRPKKENEYVSNEQAPVDIDYQKYGYKKPDKIKSGNLTLRQFDEIINEYKKDKSTENLNRLKDKYNVDITNLHLLIEYYKPFSRIAMPTKTSTETNITSIETQQTKMEPNTLIDSVFPNLNNLSNNKSKKES